MPVRRFVNGTWVATAVAAVFFVCACNSYGQIVFGQVDDFQDGTTMNWSHGAVSPNPPTNIETGGPAGAGDRYLQNTSHGGFGAGSKQIMFNFNQWLGDYNTQHVTRISGMMANFGPTDLHMRVSIRGGLATTFGSTNAVLLPASTGWTPVHFDLTSSSMSLIFGSDSLQTVLSSVAELRMLSAQAGPSSVGDIIVSNLGVDNLRAMTWPGDANFDGNVNLADFNVLAANFGTTGGATWQQGDFDFNGNVNLADFNLLAANFGFSAAGRSVTAQDWQTLESLVPEPAGAAFAAGTMLLLGRRRQVR